MDTSQAERPEQKNIDFVGDNQIASNGVDKPSNSKQADRIRNGISLATSVLVILIIVVIVPTFWVKATVMDVDRWVATVAPLADSPEIKQAVSEKVSTRIIEELDFKSIAEEYLPSQARILSGPIANSMESMVRQQTDTLVSSPAFSSLWATINRSGHNAIVAVLTGIDNSSSLTNTNGTIVFNIGVIVETVKVALVERGLSFVGNIPTSFLQGEVVLFSSPLLAKAQSSFYFLQLSSNLLAVLVIALTSASIRLAKNRRKVVLWLGMGTFIAMVLSVFAVDFLRTPFVNSVPNLDSVESAALSAAYTTILSSLVWEQKLIAVLGLIIGILALMVGNGTIRSWLDGGLATISTKTGFSKFCKLVDRHRKGVFSAGFIIAGLILLMWPSMSWNLFFNVAIGIIIWMILVGVIVYIAPLGEESV